MAKIRTRSHSRREKDPQGFQTRREMFLYFQERMDRSYRKYALFGESNSLVKTILVEHDQASTDPEITKKTISSALTVPSIKNRSRPLVPAVTETEDHGFFTVTWKAADTLRVFVDTAADEDGRFWTCYSLSDADVLDQYFDRLAQHQPKLDRIWLWPAMLSQIQALGDFRGVRMDFDQRRIEKRLEGGESTNYFKFQIWGGPETKHFLDFAREQPEFKAHAILAKVRLKYLGDADEKSKFTIDDVKYNGKFTARGTDFLAHQDLVSKVRQLYKAKVMEIEERYAISTEIEGTSYTVKGEPIYFTLHSCPIADLDVFCDVVFSGGAPFHVWGIVDHLGLNGTARVVHAVDMHTGSKLFFEVYPDIIVMYLYAGSCGNTAIRFFTNMQRMFGATVKGEDNGACDIFAE